MNQLKKEDTKVTVFNGMGESMKRLAELTQRLNGLRFLILQTSTNYISKSYLIEYVTTLESYYLEILGELDIDEIKNIEDNCLKQIRLLIGKIKPITKVLALNTISPAEKILRLSAKKHGFLTTNITIDNYQTMS